MYPTERHDALLRVLSQKGFVSIQDLAAQLNVSEITIRRDLTMLQRQGMVEKVAGGGRAAKSTSELAFMNKRVLQQAEKTAIAKQALSLIEPGMTISMSAGTTTWTLAKWIKPESLATGSGTPVAQREVKERRSQARMKRESLTFVTNSTNIAIALQANGWRDIHLTGGQFRTPSDALVGPLAEQSARQLHADLLFLGAHGVDLEFGVSSPNLQEASVHRVLMERAETSVLLFDHTKWGVRGFAHLAMLDEVDVVITDASAEKDGDSDPHAAEIAELRRRGPEVIIARAETDDT
ncbi:DeoR/GlpR family DNA-binding transcription regulator [Ferroacidibacillus organovorans]|uniref:DeoR/GlpR family DNA-binding transcription regulator n=1 Tax=Ferroacidibacillus organovorans TaxID=1765683 RepID=UPI000831D891|nr:DeoR/GlpR family DNA-binding transcription regulator [Ferroacidibacillus organovorans]